MADYYMTEGKRKGSVVYVYEGQVYVKDRLYQSKLHVRCWLFKTTGQECPARAHICLNTDKLEVKAPHREYGSQEVELGKKDLKKRVKERVVAEATRNPREVFNEVCRDVGDGIASQVSYNSIRKQFWNERLKLHPPCPLVPRRLALRYRRACTATFTRVKVLLTAM